MSLNFAAIDFETANSHRGSPCSVGLTKVRDGRIVDEFTTLIRPPAELSHFDGYNTSIHGITAGMVAGAPPWKQVLGQIVAYTGSDTLVCHNASFDMSVIRNACAADGILWPSADFLCTLILARRAYQLPCYRLPFVAAQCGAEIGQHHRAGADARCTALIAVAMASKQGAQALTELADSLGVRTGHMEPPDHYCPTSWCNSDGNGHKLIRPDTNSDADPAHPFYGRTIVFTGVLTSRKRQQAWQDVAKVGGIPQPSVTKQTNILVIGDINPAVLAPGMNITEKAAKVFALQAKGQDIELMTEDDFLRSL
jgi:DNA polymerase-3 subunit epsilon